MDVVLFGLLSHPSPSPSPAPRLVPSSVLLEGFAPAPCSRRPVFCRHPRPCAVAQSQVTQAAAVPGLARGLSPLWDSCPPLTFSPADSEGPGSLYLPPGAPTLWAEATGSTPAPCPWWGTSSTIARARHPPGLHVMLCAWPPSPPRLQSPLP